MVVADLNIICCGQKEACPIVKGVLMDEIGTDVYDRTSANKQRRYRYFKRANQEHGVWYDIYPQGNAFLENSFFDLEYGKEEYRRKALLVTLNPYWELSIIKLINFFIDRSPIHKIAIMIYLGNEREDAVTEKLSCNEYIDRLRKGEIHFNKTYYVTGQDSAGQREGVWA